MLFWACLALLLAVLLAACTFGEIARIGRVRLKQPLILLLTAAICVLIVGLMFAAFAAVERSPATGAARLVAVFGAPILLAPLMPLIRKLSQAADLRLSGDRPSRLLQTLTESVPNSHATADAHLGVPRHPINVVRETDKILIEIPVRRTRRSTLLAAVLITPVAIVALRLVFVLALLVSARVEMSALLLSGVVGVSANILLNLPFVLFGAWGAYLLAGVESVSVERDRVLVRKTLRGRGPTLSVLDVGFFASARPDRDEAGRWHVAVIADRARAASRREVRFGGGNVSEAQAEKLSAAINDFYRVDEGVEAGSDRSVEHADRADCQ